MRRALFDHRRLQPDYVARQLSQSSEAAALRQLRQPRVVCRTRRTFLPRQAVSSEWKVGEDCLDRIGAMVEHRARQM